MALLGSELWINGTRYEPCPKSKAELINIMTKVHEGDNGLVVRFNKKTLNSFKENLPDDIPDDSVIEVMTLQYATERIMKILEFYGM